MRVYIKVKTKERKLFQLEHTQSFFFVWFFGGWTEMAAATACFTVQIECTKPSINT